MTFAVRSAALAALLCLACSAPPLAPCTQCGNECVDTRVDSRNCGACGTTCPGGSVCRNSLCEASCAMGLSACSGKCVDQKIDPGNCGGCGVACSADQVCRDSNCQSVCPGTQELCGSVCVTTATDNAHCGMCNRPCTAGTNCSGGMCRVMCQSSQLACDGGTCVNGQTDNSNCGMCGRACPAGMVCSAGNCSTTCGMGLTTCVPDGGAPSCADTQTDNANCGMCGRACSSGETCFAGNCRAFCAAGLTLCSGAGGAPVCTDLRVDATNCGTCGNACTGVCQTGICVPAAPTAVTGNLNLSVTNLGTRSCAQGGEMVRYPVTGLTATTATVAVAPAAGCLATGDEVLLINQQGTTTASGNVGNWELLKVASVTGSTVTFRNAKVKFYGDGASDDVGVGGTQRVLLQRVPVFSVFDYQMPSDGGVLTADAWDGGGGVFALRSTTSVNIAGVLDMRAKGFPGAPSVTSVASSGRAGEGPASFDGGPEDRNIHGAGGGGRGDQTGCNRTNGTSGGGGGHLFSGGRSTEHCGGSGGAAVGDPLMSKLFLGPGGGAGGTDLVLIDNPPGGAGGRGGGAVLLFTPQLMSSNLIDVSGTNGQGDTPGFSCPGNPMTTSCWDFSGPGGAGAGGAFYLSGTFVSGAGTVNYGGGLGGGGRLGSAGMGGRGSPGRAFPLPFSCSDISLAMGDGEYLFAFGGDPAKPYVASCVNSRMYLTLQNRTPTQNFSRYDPRAFGGNTTIIVTRWTKVRFDPATRRIIPNDFTFSSSTGSGTGGPFGTTVVTQWPVAAAGDCFGGGSMQGGANLDLRGLPFQISANNVWRPMGFNQAGMSSITLDRQVVDVTGGGGCGDNAPRSFPNGEIELTYLAPRASCQAIKTASPMFPDGIYAVAPDPTYPALPVWCDQTTSGGGWELIQDNGVPPQLIEINPEVVPVTPQTPGFMPMGILRALAAGATQVHMRTTGQAATRSFTTVANTQPIINLRSGQQLTFPPWSLGDYTGPFAAAAFLQPTCPIFQKGWPNVYHACGQANGTHWTVDVAKWQNMMAAQESLQLYVR